MLPNASSSPHGPLPREGVRITQNEPGKVIFISVIGSWLHLDLPCSTHILFRQSFILTILFQMASLDPSSETERSKLNAIEEVFDLYHDSGDELNTE